MKYRVTVLEHRSLTVEVDAADDAAALRHARAIVEAASDLAPFDLVTIDFDAIEAESLDDLAEAEAICAKWAARLNTGFYLDTPGADYSPALSPELVAEYDADIERLMLFQVADPYAIAVKAMEAQHAAAS